MNEPIAHDILNPVLLMVDDDEEDVYLTKRAFCSYSNKLEFRSVPDGEQLFDYLERHGEFQEIGNEKTPLVILLDINMPRENGFELLARLKSSPDHRHLPVIMLTTSCTESDVRKAYGLGASSYVCKSVNAAEMKKVAAKVCDFWFDFARVPRQNDQLSG